MAHRFRLRLGSRRGGSETGFAGKGFLTLFFGIFFALGSFFLVVLVRETLHTAETYAWAERSCEIEHSRVVREGGEAPYVPEVRFRTIDGGVDGAGTAIRRRVVSFGEHGEAAARLASYPQGAIVPCFVSPEGEAVLERGPVAFALFVLLPLLFVAIGAWGIRHTWRTTPKDRFGKPLPEELGSKAGGASGTNGGRAAAGVGWLFAAAGGVMGWFFVFVPFSSVVDARDWSHERCTVEHSSVVSHRSDDGTTYSVDILYRWDRGMGTERSSRYSFFGGSSSGYDGKREIVGRYPVGSEVACLVHPTRLHEAVLEPGLTAHAWIALLPGVFLLFGLGLIVGGSRHRARRERMRAQAELGRTPFPADDPVFGVLPAFEITSGPTRLVASATRFKRLAGVLFAAVFWNGIVGVFAKQAWDDLQRGKPEWGLMLFLVPFVLVGVALVFGVVHALLALRNARPVVVASTSTPRLGDRVDLQWRFEGRAARVEHVRLILKGSEKATYRVGTNTHTATDEFLKQVLVDLPAPACTLGGSVSVTLPAGAMHSFKSDHNEIVWELALEGEIPRWPDVCESYPITVLPGRAKSETAEDA
jgi:hypothetical protein